jgi:hypothetical protein
MIPAHVIAPGYSLFDNGALHALLTPQLAVPLVALGIALGRLTVRIAVVCAGLILAALAVAIAIPLPLAAFSTAVAFFAAGLALIATGTPYGVTAAALAAGLIGAHAGQLGRGDTPSLLFALGSVASGAQLMFFPALLAARAWRPWLTVPVRIAASWLLAIGVMLFGLALRN